MCRLYKAKSNPRLYVIVLELIIFIIYARCDIRKLIVREGEVVELNFSYPCDITKTTLQHGNKAPFYNSASAESKTLPQRYEIANPKSYSNQSCYLQLTINPVSRNDEGFFILYIYNNSQLLEYPRIVLSVRYPPGKASCELSNDYHNDGEWVSLRCKAPQGTISGQIVCYQDEMKLPSFTLPGENVAILNQTILARLAGLVYCCTSTFQQTKDRCECNDFRWNPILIVELNNIPDPCAAATEMADSATSSIQQDQEISIIHQNVLDPETGNNTCPSCLNCRRRISAAACLMALCYICMIGWTYIVYKYIKYDQIIKQLKKQLKKQSYTRNEDDPEWSELEMEQLEDELE